MKICLINSLFTPDKRGGAEVLVDKIAQALLKQGHQVFVITTGRVSLIEDVAGIKVHRLSPSNIFPFIDMPKKPFWQRVIWHTLDQNNYLQSHKVFEILEAEKPDLVLSHNLKGLGYQVLKEVSKMGISLIHTLHDIQLVVPSGLIIAGHEEDFLIKNPYNYFYALRNRGLFNLPIKFVSPSHWLADFYIKNKIIDKEKISVLRNPFPIPESKPVVNWNGTYSFVGQLESHKGIDYLAKVFEIFVQSHPDAKLIIAGTGSLQSKLEQIAQGRSWLELIGYVSNDQINEKLFSRSSFSILPTLCYENFPGTVVESLSFGIPVLVSKIGGAPEMIKEGQNGFIFEPGDEESLLRALEASWQTKDRLEQISQAAYDSVRELNMENYLEQILKI